MKTVKVIILTIVGILVVGVLAVTAVALVLQNNPPVVQEPAWDSPQTREIAARACFDCHSNETQWPIWTKLPVGSWLAVFDTYRGRRQMNFSEWAMAPGEMGADDAEGENREVRRDRSDDIAEVIQEGEMPPAMYLMMHPEAKLTDAEKQQLITGLQNSLR